MWVVFGIIKVLLVVVMFYRFNALFVILFMTMVFSSTARRNFIFIMR